LELSIINFRDIKNEHCWQDVVDQQKSILRCVSLRNENRMKTAVRQMKVKIVPRQGHLRDSTEFVVVFFWKINVWFDVGLDR
jgi:hypothetical protein